MASLIGDLGTFLLDAFDGVLGAEPAGEVERRDAFVSANLMAGMLGVALWPVHWAVWGPVDFATGIANYVAWFKQRYANPATLLEADHRNWTLPA
jgi:hypothetical protein